MSAMGSTHSGIESMPLDTAIEQMCVSVQRVETELIPWQQAAGRILAEPIVLDRPSPACDVSAMDGYGIRLADLSKQKLEVAYEVQAGMPAEDMPTGKAIRIFTGAMVPQGCQAVIPREQLTEGKNHIELPAKIEVQAGQHIRRCGENGQPGEVLAEAGRTIMPAVLSAAAACGVATLKVFRTLRVGIVVTGAEVLSVTSQPQPWQLRDSNGPALHTWLTGIPWTEVCEHHHVKDHEEQIRSTIAAMLKSCDALLITGGVSAGNYDFVPAVLRAVGATIVFHRLPIRPGKPVLGAVSSQGVPIMGLPGNPVSVMVTARRISLPILRKRAGCSSLQPRVITVSIADEKQAPAKLTWFPLVQLHNPGQAQLVVNKGSGDWISAARSDGFVEVPPGESAAGVRSFYPWHLTESFI